MTILVTGAAGFIGFAVWKAMIARDERVIRVDNLNDYYDVTLKQVRLNVLSAHNSFSFSKADISDRDAVLFLAREFPDITGIIHLATQAGVVFAH